MSDEQKGGDGDKGTQDGTPQLNEGGQKQGGDETKPRKVSITDVPQNELNEFLAKQKRELRSKLAEAEKKAAGFDQLNEQVQQLMGMRDLFEGHDIEGVEDLRDAIGRTILEHQTAEETAKETQSQLQKDLEAAKLQAEQATAKYNRSQILRSVSDYAGDKATDPGALELIQLRLEPLSEVDQDGNVFTRWEFTDDDGNTKTRRVPIQDAIDSMEGNPTKYRGLFKSTVNGGAGGELGDGPRRPDGQLDLAQLASDPEKYMELVRKNPGAIKEITKNLTLRD